MTKLGYIVVPVVLILVFLAGYAVREIVLRGKLNGLMRKQFCYEYAHELVGGEHDSCLIEFPELR